MPRFSDLLRPSKYSALAQSWKDFRHAGVDAENMRAISGMPPGHFYSPLLDVRRFQEGEAVPFDGAEMWEHIDLRPDAQNTLYRELLADHPPLPFPETKSADFRFYLKNQFFCEADAYTLSALLRKARPKRVIEVGSGFSSAVMLDTLQRAEISAELTFIEPYPERLYALLEGIDRKSARILVQAVQETSIELFGELQVGDVLFIDSSHVAKVGSDVTFLLLRVLPRLAPGVWVHIHDIFYPSTYPTTWLKEGRAWNESLFLRAYLLGNPQIEIAAFNSYAGKRFPHLFEQALPSFLRNSGGSIWLKTKS